MDGSSVIARVVALGLRALAAELEAGHLDALTLLGKGHAHQAKPPVAAPTRRTRRRARPIPVPEPEARPPAPAPEPEPAPEAHQPACEDEVHQPEDEAHQPGEVQQLTAALVVAHGSVSAAAKATSTPPSLFGRWHRGAGCSPDSLVRLRQAAAGIGPPRA